MGITHDKQVSLGSIYHANFAVASNIDSMFRRSIYIYSFEPLERI